MAKLVNESEEITLYAGGVSAGKTYAMNCAKDNFEGVILTPTFEGRHYRGHICSGCNKAIRGNQDDWNPLLFNEIEELKYCPFCGKEIIRFAEPKYIEPIDFSMLRPFENAEWEFYRKLEYMAYFLLSESEREKIIELIKYRSKSSTNYMDRFYSKLEDICKSKPGKTLKRSLEKDYGDMFKGVDFEQLKKR